VDGAAYLEELAAAHECAVQIGAAGLARAFGRAKPNDPAIGGAGEALGFPLGARLVAQLRAVGQPSFRSLAAVRTGAIVSAARADREAIERALGPGGANARILNIETHIEWSTDEAMNSALVPGEALQAIVAQFVEAA
jgi:hypothetical protein